MRALIGSSQMNVSTLNLTIKADPHVVGLDLIFATTLIQYGTTSLFQNFKEEIVGFLKAEQAASCTHNMENINNL